MNLVLTIPFLLRIFYTDRWKKILFDPSAIFDIIVTAVHYTSNEPFISYRNIVATISIPQSNLTLMHITLNSMGIKYTIRNTIY